MNNQTEQIFLPTHTNLVYQKPSEISHVSLETAIVSNTCRTCATVTESVIPIFKGEGLQNNLAEKINEHLPIQVCREDTLPLVVCYQCASTLLAWCELAACCVEADRALRAAAERRPQEVNPVASSEVPGTETTQNNSTVEKVKDMFSNHQILYKLIKSSLVDYLTTLNLTNQYSDYEMVCYKCDVTASSTNSLAKHLQARHPELDPKRSITSFLEENVMLVERLLPGDEGSDEEAAPDEGGGGGRRDLQELCCPFCEAVFSSCASLTHHVQRHGSSGLACGACGAACADRVQLARHLQQHVTRRPARLACRSCGHVAADRAALRDHVACAHGTPSTLADKHTVERSKRIRKNTPAQCPDCHKIFSNMYNMKTHRQSHSQVTYACAECPRRYRRREGLQEHERAAHRGELRYACATCGEAFASRAARRHHEAQHAPEPALHCAVCPAAYRTPDSLRRHALTHLPPQWAGSLAAYRAATLPPSRRLADRIVMTVKAERETRHFDIDNLTVDTDMEDDRPLSDIAAQKNNENIYNNFYEALLRFKRHFFSKHRAETCSYPDVTASSDSEAEAGAAKKACGAEAGPPDVDRFDDLSAHNRRRDRMDEATRRALAAARTVVGGRVGYDCGACGKRLGSAHTFVFHTRTHAGWRPCVCHVCGARFTAPGGLRRHVLETHERARRRACALCGKTFANSQNLKQHARTHSGERPFVCATCGKGFAQSGSLHAHRRTHSPARPHACRECGAAFRALASLRRHARAHAGERPHACTLCPRTFRSRAELAAHVRSHAAGPAAHRCDCGASFRQRRSLRHHCRKVHGTEPTPAPALDPAPAPAPAPALALVPTPVHGTIYIEVTNY